MIKNNNLIEISKLLVDLLATNLAFGFANMIVFSHFWVDGWAYPSLFIIVNISVLLAYYFTVQKDINPSFSTFSLFKKSLSISFLIAIITSIYWVIVNSSKYYIVHLFLFFILLWLLIFVLKLVWIWVLKNTLFKIYTRKRVLIVGDFNSSIEIKHIIKRNPWTNYSVENIVQLDSDLSDISLYLNQLDIKILILNLSHFNVSTLGLSNLNQFIDSKNIQLFTSKKIDISNSNFSYSDKKILGNITLYQLKIAS